MNQPTESTKNNRNLFSFQVDPSRIELATAAEKQELIIMRESTSLWKDAWRRFRKNAFAMIALGFIIFMLLFAFIGPKIGRASWRERV